MAASWQSDRSDALRVLWIATKSPQQPAMDGGRIVIGATIDALTAAGVHVTLVAPDGGDVPRGWVLSGWRGLRSRRPLSIERHARPAVAARVADLTRHAAFDIVHVEQLQALASAAPALQTNAARVLRMQNVESAVWRAAARSRRGVARMALRVESERLRRFEAQALAAADVTITLSPVDAARLSAIAPSAHIVAIPPPAAQAGSIASTDPQASPGAPAFTWIGSPGWPPNDEALTWLTREIWPALSARLPHARLRLAPADLGEAFAGGAILLLPLRTPAGVRMRLLEAWTRGVPAIASPAAVDGLDTADGRDVLIASDARGFADAGARLASDPDLRARLIAGGRATVRRVHDPAAVARLTIAAYRDAIARHRRRGAACT